MVQGLKICLPTQGTQVQSLVWVDSTCHGQLSPVTKLLSLRSRACALQEGRRPQWEPPAPQLEKACTAGKTQHSLNTWTHRKQSKAASARNAGITGPQWGATKPIPGLSPSSVMGGPLSPRQVSLPNPLLIPPSTFLLFLACLAL